MENCSRWCSIYAGFGLEKSIVFIYLQTLLLCSSLACAPSLAILACGRLQLHSQWAYCQVRAFICILAKNLKEPAVSAAGSFDYFFASPALSVRALSFYLGYERVADLVHVANYAVVAGAEYRRVRVAVHRYAQFAASKARDVVYRAGDSKTDIRLQFTDTPGLGLSSAGSSSTPGPAAAAYRRACRPAAPRAAA